MSDRDRWSPKADSPSEEEVTRAIDRGTMEAVWGMQRAHAERNAAQSAQPGGHELTDQDEDRTRALNVSDFAQPASQPSLARQVPVSPQNSLTPAPYNPSSHVLHQTAPQSFESLQTPNELSDDDFDRTRAVSASQYSSLQHTAPQARPPAFSASPSASSSLSQPPVSSHQVHQYQQYQSHQRQPQQQTASHQQVRYQSEASSYDGVSALDSIADPMESVSARGGVYTPAILKPTENTPPSFQDISNEVHNDTLRVDSAVVRQARALHPDTSVSQPPTYHSPYPDAPPSPQVPSYVDPMPATQTSPYADPAPSPTPSSESLISDKTAKVDLTENIIASSLPREDFSGGEDLTQAHLDSAALAEVLNVNRYQDEQDTPIPESASDAQRRALRARLIIGGGVGIGVLVILVSLVVSSFGSVMTLSDQLARDEILIPQTTRGHFKPYQGSDHNINSTLGLWITLTENSLSFGIPNEVSDTRDLEGSLNSPQAQQVIRDTLQEVMTQHSPTEVSFALERGVTYKQIFALIDHLRKITRQQALSPPRLSLIAQEERGAQETSLIKIPVQSAESPQARGPRRASVTWLTRDLRFEAPRTRGRSRSNVIRYKKLVMSKTDVLREPQLAQDKVTQFLKGTRSIQRVTLSPTSETSLKEVIQVIDLFEAYPISLVSPQLSIAP